MFMEGHEEHDKVAASFKASISQFSFASTDTIQRTSPRKPVPVARFASGNGSNKRRSPGDTKPTSSPSPKKKKQKRSYAPPETYAHLSEVNDYLKEDLDVMFCGINPGKKSAELGHHYANPSNHFWWCLHQSGFTDTQVPPREDFTLPDRFSLGLTNLVDRPTAEEKELSNTEQLASVPILMGKVARYRPRVVCFVGLGIAKAVETRLNVEYKGTNSWGLRPYKLVHSNPSACAETFFFATPSTSGLVTHFQRPQKAKIFGELKELVENLKAGTASIESDRISVIQPRDIAQIPKLELDTLLRLSPEPKLEEEEVSLI